MRLQDCEQIWHDIGVLHCHLLLMMVFDCPLAFRHKKGEYILDVFGILVLVFVFRGRLYFLTGWSLWSCLDFIVSRCFTLYFTF